MSPTVLVAGVGNVFLRDDGFGVEVVQRLAAGAAGPVPPGTKVVDFGIRGLHLAFEMLDGYDTVVLVDALPRGGAPGTVYVVEPDESAGTPPVDGHDLNPEAVLALARSLGGPTGRVLIVGCEPADVGEGIGLSAPVAAAVDAAVRTVLEVIHERLEVAHRPAAAGARRADHRALPRPAAIPANPEDVTPMHELGLCESFLEAVERRAAGRPVSGIRVRVGALHRVVDAAFAQAFALVSEGTVADGATVEVVTVPARLTCADCGGTTDAATPLPVCPACGAPDPALAGGDELILESIRLRDLRDGG